MTAENEQQFIAQLTEICRLSSATPWQTSLQKALMLFANTVHAQEAVLLVLNDVQSPLHCINYNQTEIPVLYAALQKYTTRWQNNLAHRGCHTLMIPEHLTPLLLLPVPPHSDNPRGLLAFSEVADSLPQALLEQGGALLAPLVHSAQLQYENEISLIRRADDPMIARQQRQRQTYLESLYTLISTINTETNLDEILRAGLNQAMQIADMVEGRIYLLDRHEQALKLSVCLGCTSEDVDQTVVFSPGEGGPGRALSQKWMVVERDLPTAADFKGPTTHVNLPLIIGGQVIGVMRLSTLNKQTLSLEVTQLLITIADQLALTLQRGQLADQMRDQLQIVRRLYEISTAFLSQMGSSGIIFLLLRALHDNITSAVGTVFYNIEEKHWVRAQTYTVRNPDLKSLWTDGPVWDGELEFLAGFQEERMSVVSRSKGKDMPPFWEHIEAIGAKQLLYFPLSSPGQECSGIAAVLMAEERPLEENETILAWAIVQQGMAALVRIKHYEDSQKSESLLRAILESSRDGIILVNVKTSELSIRYINGPMLDMLALPGDPAFWEERALPEIIAAIAPTMPKLAEWLTEIVSKPTGTEPPPETTADTANSSQTAPVFETTRGLFLQVQNWGVYAEHEQSLGALFLFRDVTEAKALEKMRQDLLDMLVHDMRNPLSAAEYSLHLLTDPEMSDVTDNLINIAVTSTERLKKLVEMILEISRLEAGRFDLHPQALILADHVAEIAKRTILTNDKLSVDMAISYDLPFLWVDASAVTRVFENLLSNALKFVPKEQGRISVSAVQEGNWVKVEIYNNGPHISPEMQKQLFNKFAAGQYQARGYGLGLALCRLVVEAHGGNIWVRNQPEGGVSFCFTLPIWEDPDADETPFEET